MDSKLFYINKSTNCLSLNINSETDFVRNSIPGFHLINIDIKDSSGGYDSATSRIYVIESCEQRVFVIIDRISQTIRDNVAVYTDYFLTQIQFLVSKQVDIINNGIYSFPKNLNNQASESKYFLFYNKSIRYDLNNFFKYSTILELSFYDKQKGRFLINREIIPKLLTILDYDRAKSLGIINLTVCTLVIS